MKRAKIEKEFQRKLYKLEVEVTAIGNNGIGAYECHGTRGYDQGQDYVEEFVIVNITDEWGEKVRGKRALIAAMYEDDEFYYAVADQLGEELWLLESEDRKRDEELLSKEVERVD